MSNVMILCERHLIKPHHPFYDECDKDWEWRCSNCNVNLSERYDDLDINTFEELGLSYCPNCRCRIINTDI